MQADPPAASPAASPTHPQRARLGRASRSLRALTLLALPALILDHVASPRPVSDRSMQPTLNPDTNRLRRDWVLQNRWATNYRGVRLGDVVSLWCAAPRSSSEANRSPDDPNVELVKRVLALPEDTIRALDGRRIRMSVSRLTDAALIDADRPGTAGSRAMSPSTRQTRTSLGLCVPRRRSPADLSGAAQLDQLAHRRHRLASQVRDHRAGRLLTF